MRTKEFLKFAVLQFIASYMLVSMWVLIAAVWDWTGWDGVFLGAAFGIAVTSYVLGLSGFWIGAGITHILTLSASPPRAFVIMGGYVLVFAAIATMSLGSKDEAFSFRSGMFWGVIVVALSGCLCAQLVLRRGSKEQPKHVRS